MSLKSDLDPVLSKVQLALIARHPSGIKEATKALRSLRETSGDIVPADRVFSLLEQLGAPTLLPADRKYLIIAFGVKGNAGCISTKSMSSYLSSHVLNARRKWVVDDAFRRLAHGDHAETTSLLSTQSQVLASHSSVTPSHEQLRQTVVASKFEESFRGDQSVEYEDFVAFYAGVTLSLVMSDDDFEALVLREWNVDDATRPRLSETQRDWSVSKTGADPLAISNPMLAKDALSRSLGASQKSYNSSHMQRTFPPQQKLPIVVPDYITTTTKSFPKYSREEMLKADPFHAIRN